MVAEHLHTAPAQSRVTLGGVCFDNVTLPQAVERIDALVRARRPAYVVTPNVDHIIRVQRDRGYGNLVRRADLVLADGQPLVWLARLLGMPLPGRVAGSDLFPRLCAHAARAGWRVFFLGGDPGTAEAARTVLEQRCPGLNIVGVHCPPKGFERDPLEAGRALAAVCAAQPDLLFVGLGSPKQERWIVRHLKRLGPVVSIGVGISFSFVAGRVRRAPLWVRKLGLEWLHRLCQEPGRLWRRYLVTNWLFVPVLWREIARVYGRRGGAPGPLGDARVAVQER
jgi:N-acetylglucosaminyldiphosphoundecaprenol N-acetyl-beta-D-mannosaminyltransferase